MRRSSFARAGIGVLAATLAAVPIGAGLLASPAAAGAPTAPPVVWTPPVHPANPVLNVDYKQMALPAVGSVHYSDDFGAPRNGGRKHQGNDVFGTKMQVEVATVDGVISYLRTDAGGLSGNMIVVRGHDGWMYVYMHLNNDTPGTDDGANRLDQMVFPGIAVGVPVTAGQRIAYMGDSGNAEDLEPHIHFEIRRPDNTPIDPFVSLRKAQHLPVNGPTAAFTAVAPAPAAAPACVSVDQANGPERRAGGYFALGDDGGVFTFGEATPSGSVAGMHLNAAPVGVASTPRGHGYWVAAGDGGVFAFGDAPALGSLASTRLNGSVVGIAATPTGQGYWLSASDGGVFAFGDAPALGSLGSTRLNGSVVGITSTPTGHGYWLAASDGGVFAFGDAVYAGGANGLHLPVAIRSIAATRSGQGYWLLGADGGVFAFGDAAFLGSLPALGLCGAPQAVAMGTSPTGRGYWVAVSDGRTWSFGDAPRVGSVADLNLPGHPHVVSLVPAVAPPDPTTNSLVVTCNNGGPTGCAAARIADMFSVDFLTTALENDAS